MSERRHNFALLNKVWNRRSVMREEQIRINFNKREGQFGK